MIRWGRNSSSSTTAASKILAPSPIIAGKEEAGRMTEGKKGAGEEGSRGLDSKATR